MSKPSTKALLRGILSDDIEWVYFHISHKAVEWATAGFLDEANDLLEQLWKFKIAHSRDLWLPDEGLQIMWTVSGKIPAGVPFAFKDITEVERENWSRVFYAMGDVHYRETVLNNSFNDLDDNSLFFKAIYAGYENSEKPPDILNALKKFIKTDSAVGYTYFHATTSGALLAAKNDLPEDAEYFINLWGEGYLKYWNNYMLAYLMRDRKTARILLKGILAPVFKLTKETCRRDAKEIIETLAKRMANGRTLVYGSLSWNQLLNNISKLAIEQKTIDFPDDVLASNTLSKAPVSDAEIRAVEKQLNIIFPEDYRQFLLISNGFASFSYTGVTLSSVDNVDFLTNVDEQLVEIWADSKSEIDNSFGDKLKSSIIIGGPGEEQQLLLIPLPGEKWECWHFSSWQPGEVVYESFRFYMENELQRLEDNFHVD